MWDGEPAASTYQPRPVGTLDYVESDGKRHTKRHTRALKLGAWMRHLLVVPLSINQDDPRAWVAWRPWNIIETMERDVTEGNWTAARRALQSLEDHDLVAVDPPPRANGKRRKVEAYRLRAAGLRLAQELIDHGGITKDAARRAERAAAWEKATFAKVERHFRPKIEAARRRLLDIEDPFVNELEAVLAGEPNMPVLLEAARRYAKLMRIQRTLHVGRAVALADLQEALDGVRSSAAPADDEPPQLDDFDAGESVE